MNTNTMDTVVELKNVVKNYSVESQIVPALRGIDLSLSKGSMVSVTGTSGSGKSTILHMIGTLDRPSSGRVFLNGAEITGMSDQSLSAFRNHTIGFVFQMNNLLPEFSAMENVMMPGLISEVQGVQSKKRLLCFSERWGCHIGKSTGLRELSGGEQQRVAIARALLMDPPIILADEPTGNLDRKTSHAIEDLLLKLCEDNSLTMLLVTHDLKLAQKFDKRLIMEDGKIIEK